MYRVVAQCQNLCQKNWECLVVKKKGGEKKKEVSLIPIMSNNDAAMFKTPCKTVWATGPSAVWRKVIVQCGTEAGYDLPYLNQSTASLFTHKFTHSTQKQ